MQEQLKADLFIRTLKEMHEEEHEIRQAWLISQRKAFARNYSRSFPTVRDESVVHIKGLP